MAKPPIDPSARFNISQAVVLLVDRNPHSAEVIAQILSGFGVSKFLRGQTAERGSELLAHNKVDLMIIDPELEDEDGFEFIRAIRRSNYESKFAPILLVSGHAKISSIRRARDTGANFFVAKPLTPTVLLERIYWMAADKRKFVDVNNGAYIGPDRRFKSEGPPIGVPGRRDGDTDADQDSNTIGNYDKPSLMNEVSL